MGKIAAHQYRKLSDGQLVYSFLQHGEQLAATTLYERYGHLLYGIACGYFKDEALTHTEKLFLEIIKQLKHYRDNIDFKVWMFGIAADYFKQATGNTKTAAFDVLPHTEWDLGAETVKKGVEEIMSKINGEQGYCVDLFYNQNKTIGEIKEITNITPEKIKQYLQTARMQVYHNLSHNKTQGS